MFNRYIFKPLCLLILIHKRSENSLHYMRGGGAPQHLSNFVPFHPLIKIHSFSPYFISYLNFSFFILMIHNHLHLASLSVNWAQGKCRLIANYLPMTWHLSLAVSWHDLTNASDGSCLNWVDMAVTNDRPVPIFTLSEISAVKLDNLRRGIAW